MKTLLTLSMVIFCARFASAAETYVPAATAQPLFQALVSAFPQAKAGFNHSESVFIEDLHCVSNQDEYLCTGKTVEGIELSLEGGNPVPQEAEINAKLDALWKAMRSAKLPISRGTTSSIIRLGRLVCDHTMPGSGADSYECGYAK